MDNTGKRTVCKRLLAGYLTVLVLIALNPCTLQAQRIHARSYSVVDGLPGSIVNDIAQDTSGVMWFATQRGVCSYDGLKWTTFGAREGLSDNNHFNIRCDKKGRLWTITKQERLVVSFFNGRRWEQFRSVNHPLDGRGIIDFDIIYSNEKPVLVVATHDAGLWLCRDGYWANCLEKRGSTSENIQGISVLDNDIWVATDKGLILVRNGIARTAVEDLKEIPSGQLLAVKAEKIAGRNSDSVRIWVMGRNFLGYLVNGKFTLLSREFNVKSEQVIYYGFIHPGPSGEVFFGNYLYLYLHSTSFGKTQHLGKKNGLVGEGATAVFTDREKNTWISGFRGVTCIPFLRPTSYTTADGLFDNEVSSAMELRPGLFVFGHVRSLTYFDGTSYREKRLTSARDSLSLEMRIQDMETDPDGNLWLACSQYGIARVDPAGNILWYDSRNGPGGRVASILHIGNGQLMIASTTGIFRYDKNQFIKVQIPGVEGRNIRKLFAGKNKKIFLVSYGSGLYEWNGHSVIHYQAAGNHDANNVYSFLSDNHGNLWVGTSDGLYQAKNGKLIRHTSGWRIDRPVYLILQDGKGNLWFGNDDGIRRWDGNFLHNFTLKDGISGQEVNRDAGFIDSRNNLWFGTNNGLTKFHHEFDNQLAEIKPPAVFLDSILSLAGTRFPTENIKFTHNQGNLEFCFHAISFIDERRIAYQCKLQGFDLSWSRDLPSSVRTLRYNNLPPGEYRFYVRARNALGIWSEPAVSGKIVVQPPIYFTWWFILGAAVLLFSIVYFILRFLLFRRYHTVLKRTVEIRTHELKQSEEQLRKSNQAKDRFFSIIAHDLRSPFNALLGYLDLLTDNSIEFSDEEKQGILLKLKSSSLRTMNLLENLLAWARAQKGDIPVEAGEINISDMVRENLVFAEPSAATKNIRLTLHSTGPFRVVADPNMINTVIRNLISNAIKFTYPGGTIDIYIRTIGSEVQVDVKDNGCGISNENQEKLFSIDEHLATRGTTNETGTGLGLILCREFIILNKGRIWVKSEKDKGSMFSFTLPRT